MEIVVQQMELLVKEQQLEYVAQRVESVQMMQRLVVQDVSHCTECVPSKVILCRVLSWADLCITVKLHNWSSAVSCRLGSRTFRRKCRIDSMFSFVSI
jgi:hypothetical protein